MVFKVNDVTTYRSYVVNKKVADFRYAANFRGLQRFLSKNSYPSTTILVRFQQEYFSTTSLEFTKIPSKKFLLKNCLTFRQHKGVHKYYLSNDYCLSVTQIRVQRFFFVNNNGQMNISEGKLTSRRKHKFQFVVFFLLYLSTSA